MAIMPADSAGKSTSSGIHPFDESGVARDARGIKHYTGLASSVVAMLRSTVEGRPDQAAPGVFEVAVIGVPAR